MPRLPRDLAGTELIRKLAIYGYVAIRQSGSHIRLTCARGGEEHHVTVPKKRSLRVGTLSNILKDVAGHLGKSRDQVIVELFG